MANKLTRTLDRMIKASEEEKQVIFSAGLDAIEARHLNRIMENQIVIMKTLKELLSSRK